MRGRKHSLTVVLFVALAATAFAQNPPPRDNARPADHSGTGVIRGRVVTAERDPTPVGNARVVIDNNLPNVFTDAAGRFEFSGLAAGRHTLVAQKAGFARTPFGVTNVSDPEIPIDVADGETVSGIEIRMPKGAAITGRIVDELGDPVVGAGVSIESLRVIGSEIRLLRFRQLSSWETDDRGEYRAGNLLPGRYYVTVNGASEGSMIQGAPQEWARTTGWSRTFYPGVSGPSTATPIVLGAGEERTGIDFALAPMKPARLAVSLVDASGSPIEGMVNLFLPDENGLPVANRGIPLSPRNPRMIQTIEPGEWVAVAVSGGKALSHIKLSSGDDASLTLTVGTGARISGRVAFDGSSPTPPTASVRIGTRGGGLDVNVPQSPNLQTPSPIKPGGSFEVAGVVGSIRILASAPRPWIAAAAKYGDRDLLDEPLTVGNGDDIRDVQVVFTDRAGDLDGIVRDEAGGPSPGCRVVLFPDAAGPRLAYLAQLRRADQKGRFTLSELLPGSYFIVAASNLDAAIWLSTDYLERLRPLATRVTIADRGKQTLTLPCVTVP